MAIKSEKNNFCLLTSISLPAARTAPRAIYDLPEDGTTTSCSFIVLFIRGGDALEKKLETEARSQLHLSGTAKPRGKRRKQGLPSQGIGKGSRTEQADCVRSIAFVGVVRDVEELGKCLEP
jgi:hypothetical protein